MALIKDEIVLFKDLKNVFEGLQIVVGAMEVTDGGIKSIVIDPYFGAIPKHRAARHILSRHCRTVLDQDCFINRMVSINMAQAGTSVDINISTMFGTEPYLTAHNMWLFGHGCRWSKEEYALLDEDECYSGGEPIRRKLGVAIEQKQLDAINAYRRSIYAQPVDISTWQPEDVTVEFNRLRQLGKIDR